MAAYALMIAENIAREARREMAEELKKEIKDNTIIPSLTSINSSIDRVKGRLDERGERRLKD